MKIGKSGGSFAPHPAGVFAARCISLVDLGTQPGGSYQGKAKAPQHKVDIGWITTELLDDGRPCLIKKRYTASLDEKANLFKDVNSWRGRKLTPAEIEAKFQLRQVLGAACMLNIVHEEKDGKTYANVSAVMPLPAGMTAPAKPDVLTYFSLDEDEYEHTVFERLPEWAQTMIRVTPEFKIIQANAGRSSPQESYDDAEIPF